MSDIPANPVTPVTNGGIVTASNPLPAYLVGGVPATSITVDSTAVAGGTTGRILYDNAGVLGELPVGTGVATALGVNVGSAGAPVLFNGAGGTPSAITLTNGTGLPVGGISGLGTSVGTALAVNVGSNGAFAVGSGPTAWTPSDASGAGLTFSNVTATYYKVGKLVIAKFRLTFPATADATAALIGGLPFAGSTFGTVAADGSAWTSSASADFGNMVAAVNSNATTFLFVKGTSAGNPTNANLSGLIVAGVLTYYTD